VFVHNAPATRLLGWSGGIVLGLSLIAASAACHAAPSANGVYSVQSLLDAREGYGAATTGGAGGQTIVVTSNADSGPGTLREAVERNRGPVWVTFAQDMQIPLKKQIHVGSDVTIDGRGRKVTLLYKGLDIFRSHNVIVENIAVDGRFTGIAQAINVADGARDVWIDHDDLSRFNDRLINVKTGSTDVTISWVKFHNHNKVMLLNNVTSKNLFAHADRDSGSRVTLDHCWFVDTVQRNPRAQFGIYHVYNNLLENWDFYGMSFSLGARAVVEGNIFVNSTDRPCVEPPHFTTIEGVDRNYCREIPRAAARAELPNGFSDGGHFEDSEAQYNYGPDKTPLAFLVVRDNLYLGSAREGIHTEGAEKVPAPPYPYNYQHPTEALADAIRAGAGNTQQ
jgi:pectate lyase